MKKIITLFTVLLLLSCSKDDDGTMPVTFQNLAGQWKYKSIIKTDGTVVPYVGRCSSKEDYIEIFPYREIITYNYYVDCVSDEDLGCDDYNLTADNTITVCSYLFSDATVTNLSESGFKIEYASPKALGFMGESGAVFKAVIFEKR